MIYLTWPVVQELHFIAHARKRTNLYTNGRNILLSIFFTVKNRKFWNKFINKANKKENLYTYHYQQKLIKVLQSLLCTYMGDRLGTPGAVTLYVRVLWWIMAQNCSSEGRIPVPVAFVIFTIPFGSVWILLFPVNYVLINKPCITKLLL